MSALSRRRVLGVAGGVVAGGVVGGAALAGAARANEKNDRLPELRDSMAKFAQPVRVGDLADRYLIGPSEAQPVLGHVAPMGVVRTADNHLFLVVDRGGLFGLFTTRVAVPIEELALLGEHVVLIGLGPAALSALPRFAPDGFTPVPADVRIRMAIVGPFH